MTTLIHVLGTDIPHHNQTVLRFFNDTLAPVLPPHQVRRFMVVSAAELSGQAYPALQIARFADQKALAWAVAAQAREDRSVRFFFHGQFNPWLWLALLCGGIRTTQAYWHIWGADLYEEARGWRWRWFYRLRRLAQRRVAQVFATRGDIDYFRRRYPAAAASLLYFPTRMSPHAASPHENAPGTPLTLLVGNSGDRSNRHLAALDAIHRQFGAQVRVIVPMGYPAGNHAYVEQVAQHGLALFGAERCRVLRESLAFDDYLALLRTCDLGYFLFHRQQGIGTLCLLIQLGVPFVISRHNPFRQDLAEQRLPVLLGEEALNEAMVRDARQQLAQTDTRQIAFFSPGYEQGWRQALSLAAGDGDD
ncbi:TDP-N-acetylfucosamine:lipid II N-acetylfucosaminyltransferase [Dickeya dianthicola]|uniref:TDP-N-acetylfucosamine:lipid II N-acetylfucosaminyltransferase n=1 Tax=Dickeya dianthicola TaxID=204039 RepID=UPI0003A4A3E2|nr:TDP-N-acetylfucosamine:lipid II N-acetylfucosaminyltransferase [Dickeya dianthicola]AYC20967.1 TDP-N-acetylfucosamine:lipid II N-acetylfucosaminyltransferase [Dickeya dianthicola]MBI0439920.1 TDP-N-acetylfucosamine:lipid II N-acetylfucosaminyltransferase [Dickeya dianthicola]MBI0450645.1 TDP-N-acetylfucosamine:lipid II N-acetylfucosaminyltransferase [Dickeya dianthicola]MBI0455233.1 TDP-N-acetylfucosamine:lipid II N-acetylfucosaminyltransferase [Dickeya dianthicola]MBI0459454.1 TDP-N-acetyl